MPDLVSKLWWVLRGRAHALQHLVWRLTFGALAALPVLAIALPRWPVAVPAPVSVTSWVAARVLGAARPGPSTPDAADHTTLVEGSLPATIDAPGSVASTIAAPVAGRRDTPNVHRPALAVSSPSWLMGRLLLALWAGGAGIVLVTLARAWVRRRALTRTLRPVSDPRTTALAAAAAERLGLRTPVRLLEAEGAVVPSTWGVRRATVLLPADAPAWPERRLETVLLHELAHVARGDVRAQLVAAVACAFYWYNPLVWLAARAFERTCEQACDDRVLAAGRRACDYADDLLALARRLRAPHGAPGRAIPGVPAGALPVLAPSDLPTRIRAVLAGGRPRAAVSGPARAAAGLLAFGFVAPLAALAPAAPAEAATPAPSKARPGDATAAAARRRAAPPVQAVEHRHADPSAPVPVLTVPPTGSHPAPTNARRPFGSARARGAVRTDVARPAAGPPDTTPRAPTRAPAAADGSPALATLTARDGATQLVLTAEAVELRFTPGGVRDVERSIRRSLTRAPAGDSAGRRARGLDAITAASAEGAIAGVRAMRMRFPVRDIAAADYADGAVTLRMRPAARPAASDPAATPRDSSAPPRAARRRGNRGELVYQAVPEAEARHFVAALAQVIAVEPR